MWAIIQNVVYINGHRIQRRGKIIDSSKIVVFSLSLRYVTVNNAPVERFLLIRKLPGAGAAGIFQHSLSSSQKQSAVNYCALRSILLWRIHNIGWNSPTLWKYQKYDLKSKPWNIFSVVVFRNELRIISDGISFLSEKSS